MLTSYFYMQSAPLVVASQKVGQSQPAVCTKVSVNPRHASDIAGMVGGRMAGGLDNGQDRGWQER